jgi:predicted glycosyltransferase
MRDHGPHTMRVWIDLTNSPHVLVLRPVIEDLRARGHEVDVTARDFAQTLGLCDRLGIAHTAIGRHRGERLPDKARGLASRTTALLRWARRVGGWPGGSRPFDVAIGHGSNDVTVAAAALGIPSATAFDYEWATVQHQINCRLAAAVVVPAVIPPERLAPYGATGKIRPYEGLKEEYYLADLEPDRSVLDELGLDPALPLAVVRTPPEVSLYHRFHNDRFAVVLDRLRTQGQVVVLPRTDAQRVELRDAGGFVIPERPIDGPSLVALADLVVSAGGTMNREAVALGTPVYTTFDGKPGAVDDALIADGRLRRLEDPEAVDLVKRAAGDDGERGRIRRDPAVLTDLLLSAAAG